MSDPKRGTLITVGAPKVAKNNVTKTVRLNIQLDESNESKYPELNYKELVNAEERKKRLHNGKTAGLDPFSDNDDDVERVARKFEQKYGGKRTYGRKGRSKRDDFADIGAGYDENDPFIDNTDGYDEMFPPEIDTYLGGFYINCGLLEFKPVPEGQAPADGEAAAAIARRNKRRISSSSSDEESSGSTSESESQDEKAPKSLPNGAAHSHETEHRKKKSKNNDKKPNKIKRTDSSAATSGKQTSDEAAADAESDSRTSQSDSLASKPAPSSENVATSDSSRDVEAKVEVKLPASVIKVLEELESVGAQLGGVGGADADARTDPLILKLERSLRACGGEAGGGGAAERAALGRAAWARAARCVRRPRADLLQRARRLHHAAAATTAATAPGGDHAQPVTTTSIAQPPTTSVSVTTTTSSTTTISTTTTTTTNNKRKAECDTENLDFSRLTSEEKQAKIVETLHQLKQLIDERTPGMVANYKAECERVQEERKKMSSEGGAAGAAGAASAAGAAAAGEKRLPKRRFPWCAATRSLLARLRALAGEPAAAASLLAALVLPLFPAGFVRMPTLLRQADLNKDYKGGDLKRQRLGSASMPATAPAHHGEPIQFPSSLTVTPAVKRDRSDATAPPTDKEPPKTTASIFSSILNTYTMSKELVVEKPDDTKRKDAPEKAKEDLYIPPNTIGSITITPVPNSNQSKSDAKKVTNDVAAGDKKEPLIRIKSPAALNEMAKKEKEKQEKHKKSEKNHVSVKEKRVDTPLHVDTTFSTNKKEPSPKQTKEGISRKEIESMRVAENNIPRPALVPVHHSPTFAKPDKRAPEVKRKKDIVIVSDVDPLSDVQQEPVAVDDSSSDVEYIPDSTERSDVKCDSDTVPCKESVSVVDGSKRSDSAKPAKVVAGKPADGKKKEQVEDTAISDVMRNLLEIEHSQDMTKYNNFRGGVITNARREKSSSSIHSRGPLCGDPRTDKDKFAGRASLNKMDGCSA